MPKYDNHGTKLAKSTFLKSEIRFLPHYLVNDMIIVFYKNKSFILFLKEQPVGFLMESEQAVIGFKKYFDAMWKLGK